jgi:transposase-like protein
MSYSDIQALLAKMYDLEVSSGKLSQITDKIIPELQAWRARPLEAMYPIVYLDAVHRSGDLVKNSRERAGSKQGGI